MPCNGEKKRLKYKRENVRTNFSVYTPTSTTKRYQLQAFEDARRYESSNIIINIYNI